MTLPSFTLGLILPMLYGSMFHVLRGGGPVKLVLYLIFSLIGFWGGHWMANLLSISTLSYGPLNVGPATLGSLIILLLGNWLSDVESVKQ